MTTAVATTISQQDLNAALQNAGFASAPSERQARIKLDGNAFTLSDTGEMFAFNRNKPEVPAFTARIVKPLVDYMAIFIDEVVASGFGRADLAGTFSKKYSTPDPERRLWPSDEVYDELSRADLVDKDNKPVKGSWKGDLYLQILPDSGNLTGDETVYVLTMPVTSVIEFRGSSRQPEAGSVSKFNFMQKLLQFAIGGEGVTDQNKAINDALTAYALGGVVAEFRIGRGENKEANRNWPVIIADPIHIEKMQQGDNLLGTGNDEDIAV